MGEREEMVIRPDDPTQLATEYQIVHERLTALREYLGNDGDETTEIDQPRVAAKLGLADITLRRFADDRGDGYQLGGARQLLETSLEHLEEAEALAKGYPVRTGIRTTREWVETLVEHDALAVRVEPAADTQTETETETQTDD